MIAEIKLYSYGSWAAYRGGSALISSESTSGSTRGGCFFDDHGPWGMEFRYPQLAQWPNQKPHRIITLILPVWSKIVRPIKVCELAKMIYCHNLFVEMIGLDLMEVFFFKICLQVRNLIFQEAPPPITVNILRLCRRQIIGTKDCHHLQVAWHELCRFSVEKRIPNSKNICFKVDLGVFIHHSFWNWNDLKDGRKSDLNSTKSCQGCVVSSSPRRSTTTMVCVPSSRCSWQLETWNVTCLNLFG